MSFTPIVIEGLAELEDLLGPAAEDTVSELVENLRFKRQAQLMFRKAARAIANEPMVEPASPYSAWTGEFDALHPYVPSPQSERFANIISGTLGVGGAGILAASTMNAHPSQALHHQYDHGQKTKRLKISVPVPAHYRKNALHFHDSSVLPTNAPTTGSLAPVALVLPRIGTGQDQRIGRFIQIKELIAHFILELPTTTNVAETTDSVRVIYILDTQCNGEITTVAAVLQAADILQHHNLSNDHRFLTLYDETFTLLSPAGTNSSNAWGRCTIYKKVSIKLNITMSFDADAGAITDLTTHNLFGLIISDKGFATYTANVRCMFTNG